MTITIKGPHSPTVFTDGSGKTWVVSGHVWKSAPIGTTLKDVRYIRPVVKASVKYREVRREFPSVRDVRIKYVTRVRTDGLKDCTCAGFTYRRFCKHVEAVKKEMNWK